MPELPEVETVKRGLEPVLVGCRILKVELRRKNLRFPFPQHFCQRLEGARIESIARRAKYILAHCDTGEVLILHLGMTGRFTVFKPDGAAANLGEFYFEPGANGNALGPHDHVVFHLEGGFRIVYSDPRRFGLMDIAAAGQADAHKLLKGIGVEPLGNAFNAEYLATRFRGKNAPLKAALLDQRIIAGLGNIYVCEALHRAGLSPQRKAGTLVKKTGYDPRLEFLVRQVRAILTEAIAAGGSTLQDHRGVTGAPGDYQQRFLAYDRQGEPCLTKSCRATIKRVVQGGRSTFYCPSCQK